MAFAAVTILMDTLHQHFLQPTPRFPLRNKTKVKLLYKNLSSLQTSLEQDFKAGECDEAAKALEAEMRDVSVELRFQIEHELRLFYLGNSMKLRLHSAQNYLPPILNREINALDPLGDFSFYMNPSEFMAEELNPSQLCLLVQTIQTMKFRCVYKHFCSRLDILLKHFALPVSRMPPHIRKRLETFCAQHVDCFRHGPQIIQGEQESEDEDEQKTDDDEEQESCKDEDEEQDSKNNKQKHPWYMLCKEATSIIRQELRAPSYLNKYMKQRIQARHKIHQIFKQGIKLTSYIKKELYLLKVKNVAYPQSLNNNAASFRVGVPLHLQHTSASEHTISMVGCNDELNTIMDSLNQQSSKREIVSIVGMGGIGKTTLARRIYGDASFISRFDCRAWVTISQDYNPTKVFQGLLHSLGQRVYVNNETSNDELAEKVYRCLKHQRYMIIIDDIWRTKVWDDLVKSFPDDSNGSRILLTTRLKNVAEYAGSGSNFCHNKSFLNSNQSWKLFCKKVLSERILSAEFEKIARAIVDKCKGLPLAIIVAAGLLSNSNQTIHEWEHIAKNVHTLSLDHSNQQCENIIDLSYTFLPHHLKLCFLSFGCFPEDYEAHEDEIVGFWVSEGFLKVLKSKSMEDVARESLQDLVDRNLVLICEEGNTKGGLLKAAYQMHDILRELALREARKEKLLCSKEGNGIGLRFKRSQPMKSRICRYKCLPHSSKTSLFIDVQNAPPRLVHMHLKFLRVLVLRDLSSNILLEMVIAGLVHLRWLKITGRLNIYSLPLFMLWNLQTLELHCYSPCESLDIWRLPQLRKVSNRYTFTLVPPRSIHHNLESIGRLDYRSCTKELFMRIPNLRTLEISDDMNICLGGGASNWFESLVYLYKLKELMVYNKRLDSEFRTFHSLGILSLDKFLPNLMKLDLVRTHLEWNDVDLIGTLSKLEVLTLGGGAVDGQKWEPRDGGFRRLKVLAMVGCNLHYWKVTSDHFPVLECLQLHDMGYEGLTEIPSSFADKVTLKAIKLIRCSYQLISSAKHIQEEQLEYGNDTLVVNIVRYNF
ncbi:PREDICTED: putative disease resistance RPP13-like protein 3 [Ipomoea nil]|uniref:putative disease resistance RPP13-like protein 3 n=1 Tax=Ipomoea nil TaxID=35883 RepID=UPI0009014756|nr:PREDICTED: putative disease resistance RPP13-like protein 3 [Ipomoea nil]